MLGKIQFISFTTQHRKSLTPIKRLSEVIIETKIITFKLPHNDRRECLQIIKKTEQYRNAHNVTDERSGSPAHTDRFRSVTPAGCGPPNGTRAFHKGRGYWCGDIDSFLISTSLTHQTGRQIQKMDVVEPLKIFYDFDQVASYCAKSTCVMRRSSKKSASVIKLNKINKNPIYPFCFFYLLH